MMQGGGRMKNQYIYLVPNIYHAYDIRKMGWCKLRHIRSWHTFLFILQSTVAAAVQHTKSDQFILRTIFAASENCVRIKIHGTHAWQIHVFRIQFISIQYTFQSVESQWWQRLLSNTLYIYIYICLEFVWAPLHTIWHRWVMFEWDRSGWEWNLITFSIHQKVRRMGRSLIHSLARSRKLALSINSASTRFVLAFIHATRTMFELRMTVHLLVFYCSFVVYLFL